MQVCLFLTGASGSQQLLDVPRLRRAARGIDGIRRLIVHEPIANQVDPRIAPSPDAPSRVLQFYFEELAALEAASRTGGTIHHALREAATAPLSDEVFTQQVMAVRKLASCDDPDEPACTYLVAYEGPAEDFNVWLAHYLEHHPPLMLQLPALRELEVYTRVDSTSGLPFAQANAMQRNKVVFDDASALADALASPVRDAMRRDFDALPPYSGATPHFAMRSTYDTLAEH